jgi:hypothetical protein
MRSARLSEYATIEDGDQITVVVTHISTLGPHLRPCRVVIVGFGRKRRPWSAVALRHLTLEDEGILWARGWHGVAVDALRVAVAL